MAPLASLLRTTAWISLVCGAEALRGAKLDEQPNEPRARRLPMGLTNDEKYNDRETKQNPGQSSQQDETDGITITVEYGTFPPVTTTQPPPVATTQTPPVATTQPLNPGGDCPTIPFDTIVIGAGMAGLSAAHELDKAGKSYIVLERSDRVGGRMMSKDFANQKVEFGANWIAGGGRNDMVNPILELADEFGMMYYDQAAYNFIGYEKDSRIPVDDKTAQKEFEALKKASECVDGISEGDWMSAIKSNFNSAPSGMSAREALQKCKWDTPAPTTFREALECFWINSDFLLSPEKTSTYNFAESSFWDFGQENNFVKDPRGMEFIASKFAKTRGLLNNIKFGQEVTGINYPNDSNTLATVTTDNCVVEAKTIIFTPSLEVTKRMEEKGVFIPPLTPGSAISPLEAKSWVRIFFKFDLTFWDSDKEWILIGTEYRNEGAVWLNYDQPDLYPDSQIISCVIDQETLDECLAKEGETEMSEKFARENLLQPLRATYSGFVEPTDVLISDWKNDPTALGSWENYPVGKDLTGYYEYFTPRNNKLFLSGSGSCLRYWGFMHGAFLAGKRDAEWAIGTMNGDTKTPYSMCDDMGEF